MSDGDASHSSVTSGAIMNTDTFNIDEEDWSVMSDQSNFANQATTNFANQATTNASHTRDCATISTSLSTTVVINSSATCGNQRYSVQNHYAMPQFTGNLIIQ